MFKKYLFFILLFVFINSSHEIDSNFSIISNHHRGLHRSKRVKLNHHKRTLQNSLQLTTPKSDVQRDYVAATVGRDVQLDCKMIGLINEDEKIVWLKMPKGEVLTLNSNRVTSDSRISTKCIANTTPCWSLLINDVRESDTGFYVCQTNAMQNKYVYLDIMVPPKLLTQYPLERIDVNQSSHFTLTCEFYGKPEPLIKWYKYHYGVQKEIEKFRGQNKISMLIHKESSNEYECVADNSIAPTVSKKIYLNIQYSPQIKFLNNKLFQKRGERVIFDCKVNSNPVSEISWYKNNTKILESPKYVIETLDESNNRLYINNLTDSDFTDYYCVAVNALGKASAKTELVELRTISLTDSAKIFTTRISTTTTESPKLNETVIHYVNKDRTSVSLSDVFEDYHLSSSSSKNRVTKVPNHRSSKINLTKPLKIHQKQQVQGQPQPRNHFSTTKYLLVENKSNRINQDNRAYFVILMFFSVLFLIL